MNDLSFFESRSGKLSCTPEEAFRFVTDLRNFGRFATKATINNWNADKESCSFSVSVVGTITVRLAESERFSLVIFKGDALKKNDFSLNLNLSGNDLDKAIVKIGLSADLNPIMKMMVSKPIEQFLEMLINEMESFHDWKNTIE
jgi:hypothetical protein